MPEEMSHALSPGHPPSCEDGVHDEDVLLGQLFHHDVCAGEPCIGRQSLNTRPTVVVCSRHSNSCFVYYICHSPLVCWELSTST